MNLQGTVAMVTGATGGLGSRISHALAAAGCHVIAVYRSSKDEARALCQELARYHGHRALPVAMDLTDPDSPSALIAIAEGEFGRLDVLINNAALNRRVPFSDLDALTPEIWHEVVHANLTSPFLLSRAATPMLRRSGSGRIVNISSLAGFTPVGASIAYAVSKAGLNHLTRCLAVALAPDVIVNGLAPGLMDGTRMTGANDPAHVERMRESAVLRRAVTKDDVAAQVVAFCQTDSITGQTLVIDAGRFFH